MKLSKLYSNHDDLFSPIAFSDGLNVVLAEIKLPENQKKNTHNLGKTTLGQVIDFCLLARRHKEMFLFKNPKLFSSFVFFLEIELRPGYYVTVRRAVSEPSKASFKRHVTRGANLVDLGEEDWDHWRASFDRSRTLLDGMLDLAAVKPWDFRKGLGYLIRSQRDYRDVFQLAHFASAHADWKPYIAHILGFDSSLLKDYYAAENAVEELRATEKIVQRELGGSVEDLSKIEGLLLLRQSDVDRQQKLLDSFDFRDQDRDATKRLVDEIDEQISELNADRYSLGFNRKRLLASLEADALMFDVESATRIFTEVGVLFTGQIKKDFNQLVAFNRAITDERNQYLREELGQIDASLDEINVRLNELGAERASSLEFLGDTDVFKKYKTVSDQLIELRADIVSLTRQREHIHRLQQLRGEIRETSERLTHLGTAWEREVEAANAADASGLFTTIRLLFDGIVSSVIDQGALLTVSLNSESHPEFRAEILNSAGTATSADRGNTYKKLLCIAFDLAILRAHQDTGYPEFVFHDGAFETLDPRTKGKLLAVMRKYSEIGIQQIVTLIDADVPPENEQGVTFTDDEVILRLHDVDESGRLFKMTSW
ncbi:uncharacterized protein YydD (DUF2326 family) [Rhodoglobus vestalii]|uniref:Uncharacterized protein YydD (DUF2326 family) n=1 Tax=Rhodoglobus vestalii TaxID=193384 RepID=A0A8H2K3W7_9MICO|nr:DUF2326 domain-containing protein [Rhodoglobus vestalii]TQO19665.1 uncharacterized protein YydD (DUF2326 family) [Rhodoglobus vestalii]